MHAVLINVDDHGKLVFCQEYPGSYFNSLTSDETGALIYALGSSDNSCILYCMDHSGNILSDYFVGDSLDGNNIILYDDFLYIAGVKNYLTSPRACFIIIPKDLIFSLDEYLKEEKLIVYPNPCRDILNFRFDFFDLSEDYSLMINDIFGRQIYVSALLNPKQRGWNLDVSPLSSGIYLVVLNQGEKVKATSKFAVVR